MNPTDDERGPEGTPSDHHVHHDDGHSVNGGPSVPQQLRRRRDASRRLSPLESGLRDPWCVHVPQQSSATTAANMAAFDHLAARGLISDVVIAVLMEEGDPT